MNGTADQTCNLTPKTGSFCDLESSHGLFYVTETTSPTNTWRWTRGFTCLLNEITEGDENCDWFEKDSSGTITGQIEIKCRSNGCQHPSKMFDDHKIDLDASKIYLNELGETTFEDLSESEARINFERNGTWKCFAFDPESKDAPNLALAEQYGETTREITDPNENIPTGGYCTLSCDNNQVETPKNKITCDDLIWRNDLDEDNLNSRLPTVDGYLNPWKGLGRLYKELDHIKWHSRHSMRFEGEKDGWKCY